MNGEEPPASQPDPVVGYRNPFPIGVLLCREHGDGWKGLTPLTSDDLPDGGVCTWDDQTDQCGRDMLAPWPAPQPKTAPDAKPGTPDPREQYAAAIRATPADGHAYTPGQEKWDHHRGADGVGHRYSAYCALCQGDADTLAYAVLAVSDAELTALRERLRQAERDANLLADSHQRAEVAELIARQNLDHYRDTYRALEREQSEADQLRKRAKAAEQRATELEAGRDREATAVSADAEEEIRQLKAERDELKANLATAIKGFNSVTLDPWDAQHQLTAGRDREKQVRAAAEEKRPAAQSACPQHSAAPVIARETTADDAADELRAERDRLAHELAALATATPEAGYCPECGRGDCAPGVAEWRKQYQRADRLAGALGEMLAAFSTGACDPDGRVAAHLAPSPIHPADFARWRAALDGMATSACACPTGCPVVHRTARRARQTPSGRIRARPRRADRWDSNPIVGPALT